MSDSSSFGDSTWDLPEEFCEALAFYDELVLNTGNRKQSRLGTLARYSVWEERLQRHFEAEDKLLGSERPDPSTGKEILSPTNISNTRFVPRYRLGVGGQGEVWLAHDPELDRFVALKVIKETERGSQRTAARFWREAEMTGKLEHPNIVPVYEAGKATGAAEPKSPYYVMRVFGNRHLLRAITAFHARVRQPEDWQLFNALKEFHQHRTPACAQHLLQALETFAFDDSQQCDRDLREAIEALRQDRGERSGRSLQEAIQAYHVADRSNEAFRDLLNRFIDVCNAVAYAHSRGVLHRDIKPQNVMLGEFGETLVVDWGLAKVVGSSEELLHKSSDGTMRMATDESSESNSLTKDGTIVGTPSYMSPEQAWGRIDELTTATDVYSLGGVLYAILTGKPPRAGQSQTEIIAAARAGKIAPPSALKDEVAKPLEAICLKALAQSPIDRYSTAKGLAADISRWLADEPVSAWREPIAVRAKRWVKHHQTLVGSTAAAVLVAAVTLSVMMVIVNGQKNDLANANSALDNRNFELGEANTDLAELTDSLRLRNHDLQEQIGIANMQRGLQAVSQQDYEDGWALLAQAWRDLPADSSLRESVENILGGYWPLGLSIQCPTTVDDVAFSPDEQSIVAICGGTLIQVYDVRTGVAIEETSDRGTESRVVALSSNAQLALRLLDDGSLQLWAIESGMPVGNLFSSAPPDSEPASITCAEFSLDGRMLGIGRGDGSIQIWETSTQQLLHEFVHGVWPESRRPWDTSESLSEAISCCEFSEDGQFLVTAGFTRIERWIDESEFENDTVVNWNPVQEGTRYGEAGLYSSAVSSLRLWNANTGEAIGEPWGQLSDYPGPIKCAAFSPDGGSIATAHRDSTVRLWNAHTQESLGAPLQHDRRLTCVEFSPDGRLLATADSGGGIRLWEAHTREATGMPWLHRVGVSALEFSPDAMHLVAADINGRIRFWNVETGVVLGEAWERGTTAILDVVIRQARHEVLLSKAEGPSNESPLWDLESGYQVGSLQFYDLPHGQTFSPDGRLLITEHYRLDNCFVRLWDVDRGAAIGEPWVFDELDGKAAFSSDNQLAGILSAGEIHVWNVATSTPIRVVSVSGTDILGLTFSPDNQQLVAGCSNGELWFWDTSSGESIGDPFRYHRGIHEISFNTDGSTLAFGSADQETRLFDIVTRQLIGGPFISDGHLSSITFSPDGQKLMTLSESRSLAIWDIATGAPIGTTLPIEITGAMFLNDDDLRVVLNSPTRCHVLSLNYPTQMGLPEARGGRAVVGGQIQDLSPEEREQRWSHLHDDETFTYAFEAHYREWRRSTHQRLAEVAEAEQAWLTAEFHLRRLMMHDPQDASLIIRAADAVFSAERVPEALVLYEAACRHAGLVDGEGIRAALAESLETAGRQYDFSDQRELAQQVHQLLEQLVQTFPEDVAIKDELARSYSALGEFHLSVGEIEDALVDYHQAEEILQSLAEFEPVDGNVLSDLLFILQRLEICYRQDGQPEEAFEYSWRMVDVHRKRAASRPGNDVTHLGLARRLNSMGSTLEGLNQLDDARDCHLEAIQILQTMASQSQESDPNNAELHRELWSAHYNMSHVATALFEYEVAIEHYTTAIAILDELIANGHDVQLSQQERERVLSELRNIERDAAHARDAIDDWDTFISRPGARSRLSLRVSLLARASRFEEIPQSAAMLRSLDAENPENLYSAACGYALCANSIQSAEGVNFTPEQQTQRREYIDLALACLRESIAAGYSDFEHIRQDSDLAALRELPEFDELMHTPPPPPLPE